MRGVSLRQWSAWTMLAAAVCLYAGSLVFSALIPVAKIGRHSALWPVDPTNLALLGFAVLGAMVALRRPCNRIGWIFLLIGFTWEIFALTNAVIIYNLLAGVWQRVPNAELWLPGVIWSIAFAISPLLLLLFPTGQLISPRWRWTVWIVAACVALNILTDGGLMEAGQFSYEIPALMKQIGAGWLVDPLQNVLNLLFLAIFLAGAVAIVVRLRRAKGEERLQLKWFSYAAVVYVLTIILEQLLFFSPFGRLDPSHPQVPADMLWGIPAALAFMFIPLAAANAILRYRLYEIDFIIRRTLIYATLTAILAAAYFASVLVLEQGWRALTGASQSQAVIVLSTLGISALSAPLYRRIQASIDRRFYRKAYNAEIVLSQFTARARSEVDLNQLSGDLLNVVGESMQPESISLWLRKAE